MKWFLNQNPEITMMQLRHMKQLKVWFAFFSSILSGSSLASDAFSTQCRYTDYTLALQEGKSNDSPLLLFFTGSDWNADSMKLRKELSLSSQMAMLNEDFVCVELDFPKYLFQEGSLKQQNQLIRTQYAIEDLPCILLISSNEEEIYRIHGFDLDSVLRLESILSYVVTSNRQLSEMEPIIKELSVFDLERLYELAREVSNTQFMALALEQGVALDHFFFLQEKCRMLVENGQMDSEEYRYIKARLLEKDPHNIQMTHFTLALLEFQELARLSKEGTLQEPNKVIAPLEEYLSSSFGKEDKDNQWRIEMMIAQFYLDFDQWSYALEHAEVALETAPNEMYPDISRSLDYIRHQS